MNLKKSSLFLALFSFGGIEALNNLQISSSISYLYWGVQQDQLTFVIENVDMFFERTHLKGESSLKSHNPAWNSGFRLEAFLTSPLISIGSHIGWTHLQTQSKASSNTAMSAVTTTNNTISDNPFLSTTGAFSKWRTNINEVSIDFDYRGFSNEYPFRPYIGILGATIYQHQKIEYENASTKHENLGTIFTKRKNNFIGIGPRLGILFDWKLISHLTLIGDFNSAYLAGQFDRKNQFLPDQEVTFFQGLNSKTWQMRPMVDGKIGFSWKDQFNENYGFTLSLAYEFQYWWQQWGTSSDYWGDIITGDQTFGDLSMNGVVATFGLIF